MLAFQINRNRFIIGCFATSKNRESELWESINLLRHVITFNYFANQTSYYLAWSNHTCSITQQRIFLSKEFLANSYNTTATHKDDWSFCTKRVPRTGNVSLQSTTDRRCPVASLQRTSLSELGIQNHFLRRDYTSSMRPLNKGEGGQLRVLGRPLYRGVNIEDIKRLPVHYDVIVG